VNATKVDLFEDFLFRKIDAFPDRLQGMALPTLLKIVSAMLIADDYSQISIREFGTNEKEIVRLFMAEDVILRQEIATKSLSGIGDLIISFTYDELRDFILAYKLIHDVDGNKAAALQRELSRLRPRPIFEGVYRYAYLLARKINSIEAIEVFEHANDFTEHFSLNVHLLPPAVQSTGDVARLREILAETSFPQRVRRATSLLINRQNPDELLNILILLEHMNNLQDDSHEDFIRILFSNHNDYRSQEWIERIEKFVVGVCESIENKDGKDRTPEWLAFFLHISSVAGWIERERVSTIFRKAEARAHCRQALDLVRSAKGKAIGYLLSEIGAPEEASK
jgi:hypothetical protein